mmetsp:Transcript_3408/g.7612  ORF Transcript_3408/g.7612 Transcript_3408/m.7612 type:complete len:412 (-) Transcript_3408:205-1440(-)
MLASRTQNLSEQKPSDLLTEGFSEAVVVSGVLQKKVSATTAKKRQNARSQATVPSNATSSTGFPSSSLRTNSMPFAKLATQDGNLKENFNRGNTEECLALVQKTQNKLDSSGIFTGQAAALAKSQKAYVKDEDFNFDRKNKELASNRKHCFCFYEHCGTTDNLTKSNQTVAVVQGSVQRGIMEDQEYKPRKMALARVLNDDVVKQLDGAYFGVDWHYVSIEDLEERFQTDVQRGMDMTVASEKFDSIGPNLVPSPQPCPSWLCCLLPWLRNTPTMQTYRRCIPESAQVMRSGRCICTDPTSLVVGDIVYIEENEIVPADCRILSCSEDLSIQAFEVTEITLPASASLGNPRDSFLESRNILYTGSQIISGHARAIVVSTGRQTVMGSLVKMGLWPPSDHARSGDTLPRLPM